MFDWLFSAASEIASPVWSAVRTAANAPARRRVWSAENRTHLEVRGLHQAGNEQAGTALERHLLGVEGVRSAEVNAAMGRVVIGYDPDLIGPPELAEEVAEVERTHALEEEDFAPASASHPGNAAPLLREVGVFGADIAGIGYAVATSVLPIRALPPLVATATSLVDSVPWMRSAVESSLGRGVTDTAMALAGVASHTLAQQPMSLVTDVCQRLCTAREALARSEAWRRWEASAADLPGAHRSDPLDVAPRPVPMPDGPIEHVANVSGSLGLAGYGTVLALTRNHPRALAALHAGLPRPARAGREAFSAHLASVMSHRGDLVLEPDVLRRLDRVDTVVLDAAVLVTGRKRISTVLGVNADDDTDVLFERASELIDLQRPRSRSRRGRWATAPLREFHTALPPDVRDAMDEEQTRGAATVALLCDGHPVAAVAIEAELDPLAEALVEAARGAGTVVIAGVGSHLEQRLEVDEVVAGGTRMLESIRRLQSEGHVVAAVSARSPSALAGADVGVGLPNGSGTTLWGAHICCATAAEAHTLLCAIDDARRISRTSATLSAAASCTAAILAVAGPAIGASSRVSLPIHSATLIALGIGTWTGMRATGRPPPVVRGGTPWHALPAPKVLGLLGSTTLGISGAEAKRRRVDSERPVSPPGIAQSTVEGLINPMTAVLGAGAVVSASLGSVLDAGMILFVLGASAAVDAVQRVSTDRQLAGLLAAGELPARLRRDGETITVPASELVPGDVVELVAGDGVPADCRILESEGAEIDESSLTGESLLVVKSAQPTGATMIADRTSMLYQGTVMATGRAMAVVVATGTRTELGSTVRENSEELPATGGVEARISALAKRTLPLAAGAGGVLMLADLLRGSSIGQSVGRAVGLAVAAVPEGLPFVATVAETAAARRLANRGVLVRSPKTIEALGRVDVLCFDKTGTLTQGRITLQQVSDGTTRGRPLDQLDPWLRQVVTIAVRASPEQSDQPLPHPTDRAVVDGAHRAGIDLDGTTVLADLPFEPSRGYHAVRSTGPDGELISVKGAPEVVLERCSGWRRPNRLIPFDRPSRAEVDAEIERLAHLGFRVLAVAERTASTRPELDDSDVAELDFIGLLALADPVHPTAAAAVSRLREAGVEVVMITGDHPSTAEAIAVELDMLGGRKVLNGAELDDIDDDQLVSDIAKIAVFARVSPAQKARIVRQLRRADRIVAMTGDGANDVPAIKLAQVGIALGSGATPAAREAADLVITDDRIETITDAIIEGRGMWASVHDALSILLGGNLGEIAFTLGSGLLGTHAAPNARQLLIINLLTDILPALAIAVRPPPGIAPEELLSEGPEVSLGAALNRDVYLRATATATSAGAAWLLARPLGTAGQARTTGLVALVAGQLAQTLVVRGRTPLVLAAGAVSLLVLATVVQVPGVSQFFGNQPLLPHQWAIALGSAVATTGAVLLWQQLGG